MYIQSALVGILAHLIMERRTRRPTNMVTPSHLRVTLVTPCKDPRFARVKLTPSGLVHNLLAPVSWTLFLRYFFERGRQFTESFPLRQVFLWRRDRKIRPELTLVELGGSFSGFFSSGKRVSESGKGREVGRIKFTIVFP